MPRNLTAIIAARNEADRIGATLDGLADAFPGIRVIVADDDSTDDTVAVATRGRGRGGAGAAEPGQGRQRDARGRGVLASEPG